ncbi:MAG: radical SAM protein [Muribaculaceae bacterium]|nr:radical SAM protein [Muribaculaceae bacterium]
MNANNIYYRPKWTCGRYNSGKQVAIMYNLIAGYSYFFEGYSANVIGEILKVGRNEYINVDYIASVTEISMESLSKFFIILANNGLLTETVPTEEGIMNYRKAALKSRKAKQSWTEKPTREKLPMEVSNAEQEYFTAVNDGKTICSCMFELTYRCSEMCIHCYNPGATRNNIEVSHRGDYKELSLDDYKRIIDDMYNYGLVKVCLSGGDPFSKEFVWELLDYLYEKGIAVDVFTNGQKIINDVQRLADYYPRLVGISVYSGVAEDHDTITRIPGSWENSMSVVKQLHELAVPMNLKCCIMQPNLHSYYLVADIADTYGAVPQFEINITESNEGDICAKQLRLTEKQLQIVLRDNNLALYVGKEAPNYGGQKRDLSVCSCGTGKTSFCMSPNGDLRACTAFTQVYGNLQNRSVVKILTESPNLSEWRRAVVGDYTECGRHDYCDYCNLCAGLNYTEHGDFRKPAETNCYMAKCRHNLAHRLMEHDEPMTREQFIEALQSLPIKEVVLQRQYQIKG